MCNHETLIHCEILLYKSLCYPLNGICIVAPTPIFKLPEVPLFWHAHCYKLQVGKVESIACKGMMDVVFAWLGKLQFVWEFLTLQSATWTALMMLLHNRPNTAAIILQTFYMRLSYILSYRTQCSACINIQSAGSTLKCFFTLAEHSSTILT